MTESEKQQVCDYEGSQYRTEFWENQGRDYEDQAERIAIKRLMPLEGEKLLELGAGFGRLTNLFSGYDLVVLLDYSASQLEFARSRFGDDGFIYVAANIYSLPFAPAVFDGATLIRVIHHLRDCDAALMNIRKVMTRGGILLLEFANKQNLKSIIRWLLRKQYWNPFTPDPVEFVELNYDFHPRFINDALRNAGFMPGRKLTVSHFRMKLLKRLIPAKTLAFMDSLAQLTGDLWQLSPSIFVKNRAIGEDLSRPKDAFWRCPACGSYEMFEETQQIRCDHCGKRWNITNGIYNFKDPVD